MTNGKIIRLYKSGRTTREVSEATGFSRSTVARIVKDAGISRTRKIRQHILQGRAKTCQEFDSDFKFLLDGLLISDGSIPKPNGVSLASFYSQYSVCEEWLQILKTEFEKRGIRCGVRRAKRSDKNDFGFNFTTWRYDKFLDFRNRWYHKNVKVVPEDIDLNNTILLKNWIYGDGTLIGGRALRFCTDSFRRKDIDLLVSRLNELGDFSFKKMKYGKTVDGKQKYRISISRKDGLLEFLKFVGPCDIKQFDYKWGIKWE